MSISESILTLLTTLPSWAALEWVKVSYFSFPLSERSLCIMLKCLNLPVDHNLL